MKTKKPYMTPAEREALNIVAALVLNAPPGVHSAATIERAREILDLDVERKLSPNTKRAIVARHKSGGKTSRDEIVLSEIDVQMIETIRKRSKIIDTDTGPVPTIRLENLSTQDQA